MKFILHIVTLSLPFGVCSAQLLLPSKLVASPIEAEVQRAEVIAIVSVGPAVQVPFTNAIGKALRATEAKLERSLKGNPPASFQIREATQPDAAFPIEEIIRTGSGTEHRGTSRWLVFLKKAGESYCAADAQGLYSVYGNGPGSRVIWRMNCLSMEQVESIISKNSADK